MDINNHLTHISYEEDLLFLKTPLFQVNIRLFRSSDEYRHVILECCNLIVSTSLTTFNGYKKPHGMSGANVGIPFNIISVVMNRNTDDEYALVMINPRILEYGGAVVETLSNCGSIRLEEPIKVKRFENVRVEYYNTDGLLKEHLFRRNAGSFTIQHEIDHNNGILITDEK